MSRLRSIVQETVELNLKSVSALLNLSKDYVRAFDGIIRSTDGQPAGEASEKAAPAPRRPPLLIAGETGEEAGGAFVINNPSTTSLTLSFAVQGQLPPDAVTLRPPSLSLEPGAEAVVRIQVKVTPALEENRDYVGVVFVPGLSNQVVDFIVRRLPSAASPDTSGRAKRAN